MQVIFSLWGNGKPLSPRRKAPGGMPPPPFQRPGTIPTPHPRKTAPRISLSIDTVLIASKYA